LGAGRVVVAGGALAVAGFAAVVVSQQLPVALAGFAAVGAGLGVTVPLVFAAAGSRSDSPGAGVAAVGTVGYLAFVIGPPVVGLVADLVGLRVSFALVALVIAAVVLRPHPALAPVTLDAPAPDA
ncbi:MAG: MFS transporter, partial [Nitriliruptoraceae bacterium]